MTAHLSDKELSEFKQELSRRLTDLREEVREELLRSDEEQYIELAGRVHDTGDASAADLLADVNLAVIDHHINAIREVEGALMRIARRSFGICADCDNPIEKPRLRTHPAALRCRDCQEVYERSYAQNRGGKL